MGIPTARHAVIAVAFGVSVVAVIFMALTDPGVRFRLGDTITKDPRDVKLLALNEVTNVVGFLREGYAYPDRLLPRAMLLASLRSLQDNNPSLLVIESPIGEEEDIDTVTLRLEGEDHAFDVSKIGDLYAMNWKLMEIMGLLAPLLEEKETELENQLLEGMLSTLDPHTVYLDERALQEMQMSTSGKFGGLGIVISVREGRLLILSVMADTPAAEAGLRTGDAIVQVEEESTESMTVSEAATRLRGEPGTTVTLWISRKGAKTPRRMVIERRVIKVRSTESRMLPGGVAYSWVKNFQRGTSDEVRTFLDDHRSAITGGVILDLRDDSGGVMQEAIKLSDLFLAGGVIVSTRSRLQGEEEVDTATLGDPWEEIPLVVLVNHSSASASEIVAGALKMSGRATIIGGRTFGKGSIQYLRELGRGALKMTVAQYLTPGDISVQGSGIEPHVELTPMFIDQGGIDLSMPAPETVGEEDLPNRLRAASDLPDPEPPVREIHYLVANFEEEEQDAEALLPDPDAKRPGGAMDDEGDVALQVALTLLEVAEGRNLTGGRLIELAQPDLDVFAAAEQDDLGIVLASRGVTWEQRTTVPGVDEITVRLLGPAGPINAGEEGDAWLRVQNQGGETLDGLHGVVFSSSQEFSRQDCVVGRLEPGETGSCRVRLAPTSWSPDRTDLLWMDLYSMDEPIQAVGPVEVHTRAAPRPRIAASWHLDAAEDEFDLVVRLSNIGAGPMIEGIATVKPLEKGRLYVVRGRSRIESLAAGASTTLAFRIRAQGDTGAGSADLKLWVTDTQHRRAFSWDLALPLDTGAAEAPVLYQPGFDLESVQPAEGVGDAEVLRIHGIVDYGPDAGKGDVLVAYVNGEKRSVVPFATPKAGPQGLHRFSLELPLEVGPNRIVLSAIRKGQSQSFVELMYNRLR
ncbi:MAG: S41 family peptidase [Pseudomonadota bacterium]